MVAPVPRLSSPRVSRIDGFTLVELMVVLVIVGLMGTAVLLSVPPGDGVARQADTFASRLVRAQEEAVLGMRAVQVTVDADGYRFARRDFGHWQPMRERPFAPVAWTDGVLPRLREADGQVSFRFEPAGAGPAAEVVLADVDAGLRVAVDAAGVVRIDAPR